MNIIYVEPAIKKGRTYPLYNSIYNQLCKLTNCHLYAGKIGDMRRIIASAPFKPDAVVFGLGWHQEKFFGKISGILRLDIPVICQIFKPQNSWQEKLDFCRKNKFDLVLTPVADYAKYQKILDMPVKRLMYGADPEVFKDRGIKKVFDFGFSGAMHNAEHYVRGSFTAENLRLRINDILKKEKGLNCFLNGSDSIQSRIASQKDYAKKINESKMWLSTPAPFDDMPARYFEIGMSKTLIMCNTIPDGYRDIFKDGINCVEFKNDMSNFLEKFYYYLNNWDKAQKVINNTYNDFHKNHTYKKRAEELIGMINACAKGKAK